MAPGRLHHGAVPRPLPRLLSCVAAGRPARPAEENVLYDVRTYVCRPGTVKVSLALYAEHGYAVQKRHLGDPVLFLVTETGNINRYLHVWAYRDAQDRAERRARMQADPEWVAYQQRSRDAGYLVSQENQLMTEAPFFQPK